MSQYQFYTFDFFDNFRKKFVSRRYQSIDDLINDLNLMFDNCELYNEPLSKIGKESSRLRRLLKNSIGKLL